MSRRLTSKREKALKRAPAKIGIFGGSFNPVHAGHLKLAASVESEFNLEQVIFVPSYQSPFKSEKELLPASLRVRLIRQAIRHHPTFSVSLCEMRRKGLSYTVDTLRYFRRKFGPESALYFIAGVDTLRDFSRWKSHAEVLKLCRFVMAGRPGYGRVFAGRAVLRSSFKPVAVSSTDIRKRLQRGLSIRGLVPGNAERILADHYHGKKEEV